MASGEAGVCSHATLADGKTVFEVNLMWISGL